MGGGRESRLYSRSPGVHASVYACVLAREGEGEKETEQDRTKAPSVRVAFESPHSSLNPSHGAAARDDSLVAKKGVYGWGSPNNNNNSGSMA